MTPAIAILGGGPSGLLLARMLQIHGFDYVVYEAAGRANDPTLHGTTDMHADYAIAALDAAGLLDEFRDKARLGVQVNGAFDHHGEILTRTELELAQIDVPDLRDILLQSIPEDRIRFDTKVESVQRDAEGSVVIKLHGTDVVEKGFRLVVGADGVWSKVRHLITPATPKYFGVTYLRTSISLNSPFHNCVQGRLAPNNYYCIGQGKQLLFQRNIAGTYTVYAGIRMPEDWDDSKLADADAFRERLLKQEYKHYKSSVVHMIRHSDGPWRAWRHYVMNSADLHWTSVPGVALVGEAACPTLPWPGEAMGAVLYDSMQLGQEIARHGLDGLDQAVAEYEKVMLPRRREYIDRVSELGDLFYNADAAQLMEGLIMAAEL